jgi:hypothetical protein
LILPVNCNFKILHGTVFFISLRAFVRDVRTFVSDQSPEMIEIFSGIKTILGESADL